MPERAQTASQWVTIAEKFPPSLAKDTAAEELQDGQTPDAYGIGIDQPGYLYYDSSPVAGVADLSRTAVSAPTDNPLSSTATWYYWLNRLWGITTNSDERTWIEFGAPGYKTQYIRDGYSRAMADQETSAIVTIAPFGDSVAVLKADYAYVIRNAASPSGGFVCNFVQQSLGIGSATEATEIGGKLYIANTNGIFEFNGTDIKELTNPIRNNLGTFASGQITALNAEHNKLRLIGRDSSSTDFIIDLSTGGLFDYSTTGFRYTTPTFAGETAETLVIDKIGFLYKWDGTGNASYGFDIKINDDWKTETTTGRINKSNDNSWQEINVNAKLACRRWALRITSLSSTLYIKKILAHVKQGGLRSYSSK